MTNALLAATLIGGSSTSAGAALLAGAPPAVVLGLALVPLLVLTIRWLAVIVARELFARKGPAVRRDLLELVALEGPGTTPRCGLKPKTRSGRERHRARR